MNIEKLNGLAHMVVNGRAALALRKLDALLGMAENTSRSQKQPLNETEYLQALFLRADALRVLNKFAEAAEAYEYAARQGTPQAAKAWHQAGIAHALNTNTQRAILCMRRSIFLDPTRKKTRYNLCMQLYENNSATALAGLVEPLLDKPEPKFDYAALSSALRSHNEHDKALRALRLGAMRNPESYIALTALLQGCNFACDWDSVAEIEHKLAQLPAEQHVEPHLLQIARCMDERINMEVARRTAKNPNIEPFQHRTHTWGKRLKIGFLSCDFFNHATLHLMGGVFQLLNKTGFEVFAYDHSVDDASSFRKRFLSNVDHHTNITDLSDAEAAQRIYDDGIDILVDLKSMTEKTRVMLLAWRPAPVQVSYLGFPGTSGLRFLDYIITDGIITPDSSKPWYSEKLCRLPETYQCNDMHRAISEEHVCRPDEHLPENAIVFCCFNQHYKFDRQTFVTWSNILKAVPHSVLWVLNPGDIGRINLCREAERNGLEPQRIIFAERTYQAEHLQRIQLADLALDTRICNGHTTTSDALWAGVPVVTTKGTHFASRVSASLLTACGLPELIADTMENMAAIAVDLGNNPEKLAALRHKVEENRFKCPLFDTERFTRHFELALKAAAERAKAGLPPDHLDIPALPPRTEPFMTALPVINLKKGKIRVADVSLERKGFRQVYGACPTCGQNLGPALKKIELSGSTSLGTEHIYTYWVQCRKCSHICASSYWTDSGQWALAEARTKNFFPDEYTPRRMEAARVVAWVTAQLQRQKFQTAAPEALKWADFYPDTAWLSAAASDCGFPLTILVETPQEQEALRKYYPGVHRGDIYRLNIKDKAHVVTLQGALERQPFPELLLERARLALHDAGLLLITFTSGLSMDWQQCADKDAFMSLNNPERVHLFQRSSIQTLLHDNRLEIVDTLPLAFPAAGVALLAKKI